MDSSKIISLEDFVRKENRYPTEEEALQWALQLCELIEDKENQYRLLSPRNVYVENGNRWAVAQPPLTGDPSEAIFRMGTILRYLLTRDSFHISQYLDGPPPIRERNPQISVRFESIVLRLLQNTRSMRYPAVAELREDLARLQKELTGDWKIHWPCFKGSGSRTNCIQDPEFNPEGKTLKEIWRAEIGEIWASCVMAGDCIFVGSGNGNFYSIDAHSGKTIWNVPLGARIESTACLNGNNAYVGNDLGNFHAIHIKNGTILWKKPLGDYIRSSAYCDDQNVYVGSISASRKTGALWALAKNGSIVWKKVMGPVFSSPVVDREDIIIGSDDECIYCFNAGGAQKWRISVEGKIRATAVAVKEYIYFGGFGGVLYKIRRATGEIAWKNNEAGSMYSSPALAKGSIVVGNNAGLAAFFQPASGKKAAEFATGGPITASPLIVNQFALFGSNDGHFYILDLKGTVVCSFDAQAPINSSAYYQNGTIYIGSDRGLHALGF